MALVGTLTRAGLAELPNLDLGQTQVILQRKLGYGFVAAELQRVPRPTREAWETELAAQVGALPTADECLTRAARTFSRSLS